MYKANFVLPLVASLLLFSCSESKEADAKIPEGMVAIDLSQYGKGFVIYVPDTNGIGCHITEYPSGSLNIESGRNFGVSIREDAEDLNLKKKDLKEDEVNRLQNIIIDEPEALAWESSITTPEFHFVANKKIGNGSYSFSDLREAQGAPFGKDAIMKMLESAKSAKEVKRSSATQARASNSLRAAINNNVKLLTL
jgi:hypothetical protein